MSCFSWTITIFQSGFNFFFIPFYSILPINWVLKWPRKYTLVIQFNGILLSPSFMFLQNIYNLFSFYLFSGVQEEVKMSNFIIQFKKWTTSTTSFTSTYLHLQNIYCYMKDMVSDEAKKLMTDEKSIFLPSSTSSDQQQDTEVLLWTIFSFSFTVGI